MHDPDRIKIKSPILYNSNNNEMHKSMSCKSKYLNSPANRKVFVPVLPCKFSIEGLDHEVLINIALDSCSTDCWINNNLLNKLGIKSRVTNISLTTMNSQDNECGAH